MLMYPRKQTYLAFFFWEIIPQANYLSVRFVNRTRRLSGGGKWKKRVRDSENKGCIKFNYCNVIKLVERFPSKGGYCA